jgi:RNA polymerase sigma-70 factor (ECF subfamily)
MPEHAPSESEELLEAFRAGDAAAFDALYTRHTARVRAYFHRSGFNAADAEDLTQETFLRVHRSAHTFDPARGHFVPWVGTIAKNLARRNFRRRANAESFDTDLAAEVFVTHTNPDEAAQRRENLGRLAECVALLPDEMQRIVHLRYDEALTTRGVADAMGMPESTVRHRLHDARERLRGCLRQKGVAG